MSAYTPSLPAEVYSLTRERMVPAKKPLNCARPESMDTPPSTIVPQLKIGLTIIGMMAVGALIVSSIVLDASLVLLGFGVALSMMAFIGMPLILAAVGDAAETQTTH